MFSEFLKWTKMQNKPTKMELGLIELAKESALAFGKTFEEFFNTGRYKEMGAYYSEDAELIGIKLPVYKGRKAIEDSSKSVSTQSLAAKQDTDDECWINY
jgi:hypothetical protein